MMVGLIPTFLILSTFLQLLDSETSLRKVLVQNLLMFFFVTSLTTEFLSLFNALQFPWLSLIWMSIDAFLFIFLVFQFPKRKIAVNRQKLSGFFTRLSKGERFLVGGMLSFLLTTLMVALLSPPNNVDSMTYHMARVAHWIQNQNVRFYPTWIERQNVGMPCAEFAILHLQVLSRSDRFANLVQWSAYLGSIIITSLVAKEVNLSRRFQILSGFLVAVLPMAILQSTSTQNDLIVSFLLLAFGYYLIRFSKTREKKPQLLAALSLGLSLLTKGTAYIYGAAVGLSFGFGLLWVVCQKNRSAIIQHTLRLALIVILALIPSLGHFTRNMNLYGNPLSTANDHITTDRISLPIIVANLTRNAAVQLATPIQGLNRILTKGIRSALGSMVDEAASTFQGSHFEIVFSINEDYAGNFLHFVLLGVSIFFFLLNYKRRTPLLRSYIFAILLSIVLFAATIKWQPWVSRLQLPIFIMSIPMISMLISEIKISPKYTQSLIIALFLLGLPYLVLNPQKPMIPIVEENPLTKPQWMQNFRETHKNLFWKFSRVLDPIYGNHSLVVSNREKLYFMADQDLYWTYRKAADEIKQSQQEEVGIYLGDLSTWEYPLWVFTGQHTGMGKIHFHHIGMNNKSRFLWNEGKPWPKLIFSTSSDSGDTFQQRGYQLIETTKRMKIYRLKQ